MKIGLLIGGEDVTAAGGTYDRLDPVTGAVATSAAAAQVADAIKAADCAAAAFPKWSSLGPAQRRATLLKAADLLEANADKFVELMRSEIGAMEGWARFNVGLGANMLREAGAMTTQITGEIIPSNKPGSLSMSMRQPVGVVLGIAPWNAPVILGVRAIAMPLACGNSVVLKASEVCPGTHRLIGQVLQEAGLPAGTVNVITNAPQDAGAVVDALIAHPSVRRINFTGSTRVGRIIAEAAARQLKPVLLELGGKAPLVILDDADIDGAVNAAAFGAFMNQGQICMSTERVVIAESVADSFVAKLAEKARSLTSGDPRRAGVILGAMVSCDAVTNTKSLVEDATAKGAKLVVGGTGNGAIMDVTILDHVTPEMRIYRDESFGPVVSIIRVADDDEAVRVANDTEYGLSAAVFSRDITRALGICARIESGICHINGPTVGDEAQMPFGGTKSSGYGRFGGKAAINEFTELRWITIEQSDQHYPF